MIENFLCRAVEDTQILHPQILHDVIENALKWDSFCEQQNGSHLKDMIFHT